MGQSTGKKVYYLESPVTGWAQMPYNTKEVLTESGEWESPITGWVKVTCIGGGQAGSMLGPSIGKGFTGYPGGATSFASIYALGGGSKGHNQGGAAGAVVTDFVFVQKGESYDFIVGSGGESLNSEPNISNTCDVYKGGNYFTVSRVPSIASNFSIQGGMGGSNGTPYGGGGGGGGFSQDGVMDGAAGHGGGASGAAGTVGGYGAGGRGGDGVIIIEYCDPQKKA